MKRESSTEIAQADELKRFMARRPSIPIDERANTLAATLLVQVFHHATFSFGKNIAWREKFIIWYYKEGLFSFNLKYPNVSKRSNFDVGYQIFNYPVVRVWTGFQGEGSTSTSTFINCNAFKSSQYKLNKLQYQKYNNRIKKIK